MENDVVSGITLVGLGPGGVNYLTLDAWRVLEKASEIYLRTAQHPTVAELPAHLQLHSFDDLYEQSPDFESVYEQIVAEVLRLGKRQGGVVYAVPGHPYIAEATCPEIARLADESGIPVKVVEGLSFLEPSFRAIGVDAFPFTVLVDALELVSSHVPPFPPTAAALIAQVYSPAIAADIKLTLMAVYPDEHPVKLVHAAGTADERVETLALYEIDRSPYVGGLTSLYLPPLSPGTSFEAFQEVIAHLRAPDGCPWDREQTHQSLRSHLLEETYELLSALDDDNTPAIREELGDLLLQIVLHAQIASEDGGFSMADVLRGIHTKIVYRHPHVFSDLDLKDVSGVLENWEKLKAAERVANGKSEESLLDGVAKALPALVQAEEYQRRAARIGFDWSEVQGVIDKVREEMEELRTAPEGVQRSSEFGDLLFAIVNLARWYAIDAESALREANARFKRRFVKIEQAARTQGRSLTDLTMDELDALWELAKKG
ncbi:MAG TPA: nucleoside triphosphate pyrophosphohydrolase [Anaerolineales bacterium]|nr:nucleoside triphosphate pyrophosphohydrolase [Anaerolineales bacterium]